jgi:Folate-sensitive fragile site protein Fra10Ac1
LEGVRCEVNATWYRAEPLLLEHLSESMAGAKRTREEVEEEEEGFVEEPVRGEALWHARVAARVAEQRREPPRAREAAAVSRIVQAAVGGVETEEGILRKHNRFVRDDDEDAREIAVSTARAATLSARSAELQERIASLEMTGVSVPEEMAEELQRVRREAGEAARNAWELRLVQKAHKNLVRDVPVVDLSRATTTGEIGVRWRVRAEALRGKSIVECASVSCDASGAGLVRFELPLTYSDPGGASKAIAVSVALCPACASLLQHAARISLPS